MAWDDYGNERDWNRRPRYGRERDDRGPWDRAGDEMRSWFGDEEAERRRRHDMRERGRFRPGPGYDRDVYDRYEDPGYRYGWAGSGRAADRDYDRHFRGEVGYGGDVYDRDYYGYRNELERGYGPDFDPERTRYGRGAEISDIDDVPGHARGWAPPGPHAGRGPEGYQRANERIIEDVNERITWHGRLDARKIQVSAENGEVKLEGTVDSRRAKRLAEDAAEDVAGVRDVHNRLRIQRET